MRISGEELKMLSREFRSLIAKILDTTDSKNLEIDVSYEDFSEKQWEILLDFILKNKSIVKLNFTQVVINDFKSIYLSLFLKKYEYLLSLDLSYCALMSKHLENLKDGLQSSKNLKNLNLTSNYFCAKGLEYLKQSFLKHKMLRRLVLSKNTVDSDGCKSLSELLKRNKSLSSLEMSDCSLSCHHIYDLVSGLKNSVSLRKLDLSYNNIESFGSMYLAQALVRGSRLKSINLFANHLTNNGILYFCFALRKQNTLSELEIYFNNQDTGLIIKYLRPYLFYNEKRKSIIRTIASSNKIRSSCFIDHLPSKNYLFLKISKFYSSKDLMSFYLAWRSERLASKTRKNQALLFSNHHAKQSQRSLSDDSKNRDTQNLRSPFFISQDNNRYFNTPSDYSDNSPLITQAQRQFEQSGSINQNIDDRNSCHTTNEQNSMSFCDKNPCKMM